MVKLSRFLYLCTMNQKPLCSRCNSSPGDYTLRECVASPRLSNAVKEYLSQTYFTHCCQSCLEEITRLVEQAAKYPATAPGQLQEGIHYYKEGPYFVFTELYHIGKGYCCNNFCRHCAYGYKQSKKAHTQ